MAETDGAEEEGEEGASSKEEGASFTMGLSLGISDLSSSLPPPELLDPKPTPNLS